MRKTKVMCVFGTRPEAIKMAPLIKALQMAKSDFEVQVCITAQQREMLDQVLELFQIQPDYDLDVMQKEQGLAELSARLLLGLKGVYEVSRPDWVFVHGDTATTLAASLAAFYQGIPVAHIEAGLRTGNMQNPFPEEMNRVVTSRLASLHFAPTLRAYENLVAEGVDTSSIRVVGNTVIDALYAVIKKLNLEHNLIGKLRNRYQRINFRKKLVFVTEQRCEKLGTKQEEVLRAVFEIARHPDVEVIFPVHFNSRGQDVARRILSGLANVHLIEPVGYLDCVYLMSCSHLIITDSGGLQEEGPALGLPVLVTRDTTERQEAIDSGAVKLVGTERTRIMQEALRLIEHRDDYEEMSKKHNPYGDGRASERILEAMRELQGWSYNSLPMHASEVGTLSSYG